MLSRTVPVAVAWLGLMAATGAGAATPSLVVDVESGRVLHAERATDPWYPASITKLMTVYVALDLVRQGKVSLGTPLTLSARAAAEPPSKMAFRPGTQVTLDNALKIIMVKSANDVAMMIGENLGGSVEGFAELMNDASRRLGMRESRWYNPNGLPDERQQTSARDMAVLARALLREFPEQEGLFHIGALKLGPQIIRNHNGLLGRYPGADGMKTGFICAGGFNVVASATQNGRRIITVVMGYPSARERDLRAADLFDQGFNTGGGWGAQQVENLPPSSAMSPPNMRPIVCSPNRRQPEADDESAVVTSQAPSGNSDNPVAALFSQSSFSTGAGGNAAVLGGRRTLGPRVEFAPIPIWIGATPGTAPDGPVAAPATRIASKPVRTKLLGRSGAVPASAQAFSTTSPNGIVAPRGSVDMLKSAVQPSSRTALGENLDARPAAEIKPRPGAIGARGTARPRLGAIEAREPAAALAPSSAVDGVNPDRGAAAKPAYVPRKPAPERTAKVQSGPAKAQPAPAAKPAPRRPVQPKPEE